MTKLRITRTIKTVDEIEFTPEAYPDMTLEEAVKQEETVDEDSFELFAESLAECELDTLEITVDVIRENSDVPPNVTEQELKKLEVESGAVDKPYTGTDGWDSDPYEGLDH